MTRTRTLLRIVLWAALAATAVGQNFGSPPPGPPPGGEYPSAGFWPTERMMDLFINRITEEMAKEYGFDDAQLENTRELLRDRFPRWLQDNRAELQTLTNQWIEAIMGNDPPAPEEVADWARRAKPLFGEFTTMVEDTVEDMGTYLTDEQRILVDGQMAAFRVGTNYMNQRLETWSRGGYDWRSEWPRSEQFKNKERERRERLEREAQVAKNTAMGLPSETGEGPAVSDVTGDGVAGPTVVAHPDQKTKSAEKPAAKDAWAQYVEDFIRRYQLDEGQRNLAQRYLRDQTTLRDRYLKSKISRINAVETKLRAAKDDEEKKKVAAELEQLNAPMERMFDILKDRLNRLPTRKQRAAAEATTPAAGEGGSSLRDQMETRAKAAKNPVGGNSARTAGDEQPTKPRGG